METATNLPTSLDATDDQESPSTRTEGYYTVPFALDLDNDCCPIRPCDKGDKDDTRKKIYAGPMSTEPNFLTTLPLEIVYRILNCMWPEEYSGLAFTCRLALELTNNQVQVEQPHLTWEYVTPDILNIYFSQYISWALACGSLRYNDRFLVRELDNCCTLGLSPDEHGDDFPDEHEDVLLDLGLSPMLAST
jgi:hypothetical protein